MSFAERKKPKNKIFTKIERDDPHSVEALVDNLTGVVYFCDYNGNLTPRYMPNGELMVLELPVEPSDSCEDSF